MLYRCICFRAQSQSNDGTTWALVMSIYICRIPQGPCALPVVNERAVSLALLQVSSSKGAVGVCIQAQLNDMISCRRSSICLRFEELQRLEFVSKVRFLYIMESAAENEFVHVETSLA